MKKRLSIPLASLLLLITVQTAHAAVSTQCRQILSLSPVSPYTTHVLARADSGLTYARGAPVDPQFLRVPWTEFATSEILQTIDSRIELTDQADDLIHNSACFHFDVAAVQCKMEEVRSEMNTQIERGSFSAILRLGSLYNFLNERIAQMNNGAFDPTYQDASWGNRRMFDPPSTSVYCCDHPGDSCVQRTSQECTNRTGYAFNTLDACASWGCQRPNRQYNLKAEMCPYDSDYAPPFLNGYGCDESILSPRASFPPIRAEEESLKIISRQLDEYRSAARQFLSIQQTLDSLTNQQSVLPPPPEPRTHLLAVGCRWDGGLCENDPTIRCTQSTQGNDCGPGNTCKYPPTGNANVCKQNRNLICFDDSQCQIGPKNVGPCIKDDGKKPGTAELRGPFSVDKNHLEILNDFLAQRLEQAVSRQNPDDLKYANEFSPDQKIQIADRSTDDAFTNGVRGSLRVLFRLWSAIQGRNEAATFPYATDAELEVAHGLDFLRSAISDLANLTVMKKGSLVMKKGSLRSFVVDYASFLRRSCIERPCNASLEEILKIVFKDECFPYTNGEYLNDTPDNPRWKQCAEKAGLSVP